MKQLIILVSLSFLFPQNQDTYVNFDSLIKKDNMYYYLDTLFSGYSVIDFIPQRVQIILLENGIRKSYEIRPGGSNPHFIERGIWNEEGKREQVSFTTYYKNGNIKKEGKTNDNNYGEWFGPQKTYYENGQLWSEGTYGDYSEEPVGIWKYYYENGNIMSESYPDSLYKRYYENGQIKEEKNYKDDKKDGQWIWYYENGQIEKEENYKDDKKDGQFTSFYENGQIKEEKNFKDGKWDGKYIKYQENGQIKEEKNFKDGKQDGKWIYYYENGSLRKEEIYKDGELIETKEY